MSWVECPSRPQLTLSRSTPKRVGTTPNKSRCHAPRYSRPLNVRCRLILVRASDFAWLQKDPQYLRHLHQVAANGHNWIPAQDLPFNELILFAYAADRTPRPTYVCLPSGLYHARTGRVLPQTGPSQEITPLPGIYFFDGWRAHPTLDIPVNLPSTKEHQHTAAK